MVPAGQNGRLNAMFAVLTEISDSVLSGAATTLLNSMVMVKLVLEINIFCLSSHCSVLKANIFWMFNLQYRINHHF